MRVWRGVVSRAIYANILFFIYCFCFVGGWSCQILASDLGTIKHAYKFLLVVQVVTIRQVCNVGAIVSF